MDQLVFRKSRSGSETRKRLVAIRVRLTPEEKAEVEEASRRFGLTPASYAREQMLNRKALRSVRRPSIERELLAKTLAQLGKVGSNMNQIARAANIGKEIGCELDSALTALRGIMVLLLRSAGHNV